MEADRRQFVRATGLGFAALAIPGWFTACHDQESGGAARGPLADALAEARRRGRPLLVVHVEDEPTSSEDLGRVFGSLLMYGTDEELAPLAACDLACASTGELAELAPNTAARREVRALLVPPGREPFDAVLRGPPELEWPDWRVDEAADRRHEDSVRARNAWLARQIADAVGTDLATLERRAADERAAVGVSPAGATPHVDFARAWPCEARLRAAQDPAQRAAWLAALAGVVRERWLKDSPEGSTWAVSGGCGLEYEKPARGERMGVLCGMGHTPAMSQRFLHFYTAEERNG